MNFRQIELGDASPIWNGTRIAIRVRWTWIELGCPPIKYDPKPLGGKKLISSSWHSLNCKIASIELNVFYTSCAPIPWDSEFCLRFAIFRTQWYLCSAIKICQWSECRKRRLPFNFHSCHKLTSSLRQTISSISLELLNNAVFVY